MLDVLLLLSVTGRFLQSLDNEGGGGWNDRNGGLTVLDGKSDCDSQTFLNLKCRQCLFSTRLGVCDMRTQSPVALAISSPTFFGDRPKGPILGAKADEAPTSPPVALRWL